MQKRTIWGVGRQFLVASLLYSVIILILDHMIFGERSFVLIFPFLRYTTGTVLIVVGFSMLLISIITIKKVLSKGKLITTGIYGVVRHPIYGAWIVFIIPGIVLINGRFLALTIPIVMYVIFRMLIKKEEGQLIKLFGVDYLMYKQKVNAIFPRNIYKRQR